MNCEKPTKIDSKSEVARVTNDFTRRRSGRRSKKKRDEREKKAGNAQNNQIQIDDVRETVPYARGANGILFYFGVLYQNKAISYTKKGK